MRATQISAVAGAVAILAGLLVFASCGGKGNDAEAGLDVKSLKIGSEGSKADPGKTAEWPTDMFEGLPKFAFGKIERVSKGEEGGMMKFNIYFRDIENGGIERYVELLNEAGWKTSLNNAGGPGGIVGGEKGDLGLNFMFSNEDGTGVLAVFSGMK